ncbi:sensor domain-containing protein [Haladaptatus salinisoli]|uniref:sensor domain-containing protein n=1 Tax=Haladaptatus salinisoli TaxID=2884876 RepID=UPI001D0BB6C0|nr:sensor domain-containing protein [Haladaptatus salinisoli]
MSTQTSSRTRDSGGPLSRVLRAPARAQTYRNLLYLASAFPRGIAYFVLLMVGVSAGIPLLFVGIGVPILLLLLAAVVGLATFERTLVGALLGVDVPPAAETEGGLLTRAKRLVTEALTWKAVAYLLSVFVLGNLSITLLASVLATSVSFVSAPLYYRDAPVTAHAFGPIPSGDVTLDLAFGWDNLLVGLTTTVQVGSWQVETLPGALLVAGLGCVLLLCSLQLFNVLAQLWGRYARVMLAPRRY